MPARKKGAGTRQIRPDKTRPSGSATSSGEKSATDPRRKSGRTSVTAGTTSALTAARNFATLWTRIEATRGSEFRLQARRPDDLLVFELRVTNLKLAEDKPPRLVPITASRFAAIIIELPAQHFGEEVFLDATGPEVVDGQGDNNFPDSDPQSGTNLPQSSGEKIGDLPASRMRMAGPSRLVFRMPDTVAELPLTYEAVLSACKDWPMALSPLAVPGPTKFQVQSINKEWLEEIVTLPGWAAAVELADSLLEELTSTAAARAVTAAANRVAKQITDSQSGRPTARDRAQIQSLLASELDTLQSRFAGLRDPDIAELGEVLLAIHATQKIARSDSQLATAIAEAVQGLSAILKPHDPASTVTAVELPYRLVVSPLPASHWRHRETAVAHRGRTELWHTSLSNSTGLGKSTPAPIRAIWSPDYQLEEIFDAANNDPPKPFRMSLDGPDREALVKLMAGFTEKQASDKRNPPSYKPLPGKADRLMLSALGGLLDAEGHWDYRTLPAAVGLEQWRHLTALGRDQYVRVVYRGYLYPFGHSASLIKVTERKFENHTNELSKRVAVLRQRFFIVVREPVRTFDGKGHVFEGRNFPFKSIRIHTRVTPNLRAPEQSAVEPAAGHLDLFTDGANPVPKRAGFWPMVSAKTDLEFDLSGEDIAGKHSSFSMPLLFVGLEANQLKPVQVREAYNAAMEARRNTQFDGSSICYAPLPLESGGKGDPRLPTTTMVFRGANDSSATILDPHIYPEMAQADIGIRSVQRLLNNPDATLKVVYPDIYNTDGFVTAANKGELFLEAVTPFAMAFGESSSKSDSLGAIASPGMDIAGLSRSIGPTGDPGQVQAGTFDPLAFFKDAKILGGIRVADLLATVNNLDDAPKMLSKELPQKLEASFDWHSTITQSDPAKIFIHTPKPNLSTLFSMYGVVSAPIGASGASSFESTATLENFKVNLFGFITIWFDRLDFVAKSGSKTDVMVELHPQGNNEGPVAFGGPLEFINQLSDIIPMDGFSDPPNIAVSPSGLTASYSLGIPNIQVGIFALTNMSIGAGFSLPFNNEPMQVRFNFSERENPFSLTVSLFGGGGFFALEISTEGVNEIEAALEFGAAIAIDLGVASGGVEVKGGVYFHWLEESVELSGYVRLHGELSVIGLISASLTFNLSLSYLKENNESVVWGEASLIIEVEVLVFSGSVEVHCQREFAGSASDPTFLDLMPVADDWARYCDAFALEETA